MHSDKSNEGFWHTGMPLLVAGAMFSLALQRHDVTPPILFLLPGIGFLLVYFPTFWAIPTTMLKQDRGGRLLWTDPIRSVNLALFAGNYTIGYLNDELTHCMPALRS